MHSLRYVTGLGGVGHVNIHVNLRHMHILYHLVLRHWVGVGWTPRRTVLWRSQVEPWKTVWQCELEKKTRRVFRNKFPVIYRLSFENHFKIPGNFEPILGHESVVSLWRKRHFFKKPSKRWRGFPPGGMFLSMKYGFFPLNCPSKL